MVQFTIDNTVRTVLYMNSPTQCPCGDRMCDRLCRQCYCANCEHYEFNSPMQCSCGDRTCGECCVSCANCNCRYLFYYPMQCSCGDRICGEYYVSCANCRQYLFNSPMQCPCGDRICGGCFESFNASNSTMFICPNCNTNVTLSDHECFRSSGGNAVEKELKTDNTIKCRYSAHINIRICDHTFEDLQLETPENSMSKCRHSLKDNQPNCRLSKTDKRIEEDEEGRPELFTQDSGYGGSLPADISPALEEATKYNLQDSELVSMPMSGLVIPRSRRKFNAPTSFQAPRNFPRESTTESQNASGEIVYSTSLVPLSMASDHNKPDPLCSFMFDDTTDHSYSSLTLHLKEEETQLASQELILPNNSKMSHMLMLSTAPSEETGTNNNTSELENFHTDNTTMHTYERPSPFEGPNFKPFLNQFEPYI